MSISFFPYQLRSRGDLNQRTTDGIRKGSLIRWGSLEQGFGYADLFPWSEFGDVDLLTHQESLRTRMPTDLAKCSLALAQRDAAARRDRRRLGSSMAIRNNKVVISPEQVTDQDLITWKAQGFTTLKIKCGKHHEAEVNLLRRVVEAQGWKVRLDFNGGSVETLTHWMRMTSPAWDEVIEYVEDPSAYDHGVWQKTRERWPVAVDFERPQEIKPEPPPVDVLIFKPARQTLHEVLSWVDLWRCRLTVTSSMDHPVGVAHALSYVSELRELLGERLLESGCLTLDFYEESDFSRLFPRDGAYMKSPDGFGVGFDSLLESLDWQI